MPRFFFQEKGSGIECQFIVVLPGSDRAAMKVAPWPVYEAFSPPKGPNKATVMECSEYQAIKLDLAG